MICNKKRIEIFDIIIYILVSFAAFLTLYPFLNVVAVSLSDYSEYIKNPLMVWPHKLNLDSFEYVFENPLLKSSYINTILVTVGTVVFGIFLTVTTAYPLSRKRFKGKIIFMNLILFTMLFNGGLIPNYYLIRSLKLLNTLWALILPSMLVAFNIILMKNFFESIPDSLEEAAKIDGASDIYILFKIIVPLSIPIIATLSLFKAVGQWNSFFTAVIYLKDSSKWTLQLLLRELIMTANVISTSDALEQEKLIMPETIKYAALLIVMMPIMCIYPFIQRYFVKGIMVGAVKG